MKIYIITKGSYSDSHICGVAVDLKEAERLQNINTDEYDMARIETYDTEDNGEIEGWLKHRYVFRFNVDDDDVTIYVYGIYHYVCVESDKPFSVVEKIAYDCYAEWYAEWKATQEGLS